ncbi:MAG TPA: hypothetical protein VEA44_08090 [Caulobacter sp.]|nr:hypothetical protein [Caulobacter sp.]
MPIIPRYQSRGGPRVGGLDYAAAYSPPDGSDWRTLARAAGLAGDVSAAFKKGQAPTGDPAGAVKAGLSEIDTAQAEIQALNWRRGQLDADGQAGDADQAELSRQAAGEGLSSGVRAAFDALTAPRVEGYSALADSRRDDQRSRAAQAISQARQALGVEEFLKLADVAPSQARAALGSAAAAAGELARASGADEAGVADARRATLVAAQVRRIGEMIGRDPARATKILEEEVGVLPDDQRARLSREVELEQARVDANQAAAQLAGERPDLVEDLDGFLAGMEVAAGEGAHRIDAFRAAGMGAWRAARAAREAMESQAWAAVSPLLEPGSGVHSWTQLPADLWRALSERQQRAVQARLASPWAESDGPAMAAIRSLAANDPEGFREADLMVYAIELKPTDLDRMLGRQALARVGGVEWSNERNAWLGEQEETVPGTTGWLHQASLAPKSGVAPKSKAAKPKVAAPKPKPTIQPRPPRADELPEWNDTYDEYPKRVPWRKDAAGRDDVLGLALAYETTGTTDVVSSGIGDDGGKSYGRPQFASNYSMPQAFLDSRFGEPWRTRFQSRPGVYLNPRRDPKGKPVEFERVWREIDAGPEGPAFRQAQEKYAHDTYLEPALKYIKQRTGIDLSDSSTAVKSVIYSIASHHSTATSRRIFRETFAGLRDGGSRAHDDFGAHRGLITERNLINALYDKRREVMRKLNPKFSPRRFDLEQSSALDLQRQQWGDQVRPLFFIGIPGPTPLPAPRSAPKGNPARKPTGKPKKAP